MSPRDWTERVRDILEAVAEIQTFTQGMDLEAFRNDTKTLKAVELNFIVIGEAATHIPQSVQDAHPEVPWRLMQSMRNRLVHVYFSVDPDIVWETVHDDLPRLIEPLTNLVAQSDQEDR